MEIGSRNLPILERTMPIDNTLFFSAKFPITLAYICVIINDQDERMIFRNEISIEIIDKTFIQTLVCSHPNFC